MKRHPFLSSIVLLLTCNACGQVTNGLPGRSLVKLLPDYLSPRVLALNQADGATPGSLLALNPTNGTVLAEIGVSLSPTDMAITPTGEALYVINAGSRTISKVDLGSFAVVAEKAISTPNSSNPANPLYVVAAPSNLVYYTDGAWGPEIYALDFGTGSSRLVLDTGGNQDYGAGGMALNRGGTALYAWRQYGWGAGSAKSWVTRYAAFSDGTLTPLEDSFSSARRDPVNTPVLLDRAERWVFNKQQMFAATNLTILLNQFPDNIYAISLDGTVAFGPTEVFDTDHGTTLTNLPFSTTVQCLSGDQTKLFRYDPARTNVVVYDMAGIAPVTGPNPVPTPADGAVVSLSLSKLNWTVSPIALAYDVYFGTNQAQVAGATRASAQFLGRVASPSEPLPQPLSPATSYFWRVDVVAFGATNTGSVWSFTASTVSISPSRISYSAIAGYNPRGVALGLTSAVLVAWSAAVTGSNWLALAPVSGTAPGTANLTFNSATLPPGQYTNNVEFTLGTLKLEVPVALEIKPLNLVKLAADPERPYLYALQPPALSGQDGLLLFINTTNGNIDKTLTIGVNPTDLTVNHAEGRLYIASWGETWTYVVDLNTQTLLPPLNLGTDVYKISAGHLGRIITEGEDQWIAVNLVNTATGAIVAPLPYPEREGDGVADPNGNVYYHCDNNISNAHVHKFLLTNDAPMEVAESSQHPYGTRNLVMSADGNRLFWNSYVYDTNLTELRGVGTEVYSCSTDGAIAFGGTQAFDTGTGRAIYDLPATTTVSAVDGANQRFWYFNSAAGALASVPLRTVELPSIVQQPAADTQAAVGQPVELSVAARGLGALSYQWVWSGTNVIGGTNAFLALNELQPSEQGEYQVIVANGFGAVTSAVAHVSVLAAPSLTQQSASGAVPAGDALNLFVNAAGSSPMSYRWVFENATIPGATNATLTIPDAQSLDEGIYRAVVSNRVGSVTSAVIAIRIAPSGPRIVSNPATQTLPASSDAVFNVVANGSEPLAYQWYFNHAPIAGATASEYRVSDAQTQNAGSYAVIVANSLGSATSSVAPLIVTPMTPYFGTEPVGAAVPAGSSQTLSGVAKGSEPISYQWQHAATNIPGATSPSLTLTNVGLSDGGAYALVAFNAVGVSTSAVAQVTVYQEPTIAGWLTNQVVEVGDDVTLAVQAVGTPTLGYVWDWNGVPLPGSAPTLTLAHVSVAQSGYYRVTVTNQFGSASSSARVSVLGLPAPVVAWGDDSGGQTRVPDDLTDAVAVAGGDYHSLALRHDGTLVAWGYDGDGQTRVPTNTQRFVAVAAGGAHNLALLESGALVAWGRDDQGQTNIPAAASSNLLAIAAGDAHSLALLASGTVVAWGDDTFGQTAVPPGLSGVAAITAGRLDSLALRTNGTVVGWGFNAFGQSTAPAGLSNVVAVAPGYLHSVALLANGTVIAWGDNTYGQTNVPAGLTNVVAIAAGDFVTFALRADGSVVAWGDDAYGETDVPPAVRNAVAVAAGNYHGLALVPAGLGLQLRLTAGGVVVRWDGAGVLQWAPAVVGPFTDVPSPGNPFTNVDMGVPIRFFRVSRGSAP